MNLKFYPGKCIHPKISVYNYPNLSKQQHQEVLILLFRNIIWNKINKY